jgi:GxxExxY protein
VGRKPYWASGLFFIMAADLRRARILGQSRMVKRTCLRCSSYLLVKRLGGGVVTELLHAEITEQVLGSAFEVHSALGPGFLESIYEEALNYELLLRGLRVDRQVRVPIFYKKCEVGTHVLDLIVADKVVVELKAIAELADVHQAIAWSYLAATNLTVALLINFGQSSVKFKRIVRQRKTR